MSSKERPNIKPPVEAPEVTQGGKRALQQMLPASWRFAYQTTLDLLNRIEHLAWRDRADALDVYFSRQADGMLGTERVSAMVGGSSDPLGGAAANHHDDDRAAAFATWCRAITTAVMIDLERDRSIKEPVQALTYLVARDWHFAKSAAAWVAKHGMAPIADVLNNLPGYAIVLLATSPNDTAERFLAREAFWQAVQKKT
ncbi:MAG: hypothetical protein ACR2QH_17600 [Geminicoccaceae bacterium]